MSNFEEKKLENVRKKLIKIKKKPSTEAITVDSIFFNIF